MKFLFACILIIAGVVGCTPDDPTIVSFDDQWRFVVADSRGVSTISMPSGELINGSVWSNTGSSAPYPVRSIHEFRSELFVLVDEQPWIVVLKADVLTVIDTIDLGAMGSCIDIAFANATTAYVTCDSSAAVGIIDLTTYSLASSISLTSNPAEIAVVGNQITVALPTADQAAIIDTRTNTVEVVVPIPTPFPYYVEGDGSAGVFAVVSLGAGKYLNDERAPTTPTMTFIDIEKRIAINTIELTSRASEGPQQIVRGLAINVTGYAFNPVQNGLLRTSTFSRSRAAAMQFTDYHRIAYDAARAELMCIKPDGKSIDILDEFGETIKRSASLPDSIVSVVAISR